MSYGTEAVDSLRPTADMPGLAMLTGMLGNALGYRRTEPGRLEALQARLSYAARLDRRGEVVRDFQTARLGKGDTAWTTRGRVGRDGGPDTYDSPVIRQVDYHADRVCVVALALAGAVSGPTLDDLGHALAFPARPLFIGRKACAPSAPLMAGFREGADLLDVLMREPLRADPDAGTVAIQVDGEPRDASWRGATVADRRSWGPGAFGGGRRVSLATVPATEFGRAA